MSMFGRKPRVERTVRVERIAIDAAHGIDGRDTMWLLKLEGIPEILRIVERRADDGHLPLTRPGDTVTVTRKRGRVIRFVNDDLAGTGAMDA